MTFNFPVSSTVLHYYCCSVVMVFHYPETVNPNEGSLLDVALVMAVLLQRQKTNTYAVPAFLLSE